MKRVIATALALVLGALVLPALPFSRPCPFPGPALFPALVGLHTGQDEPDPSPR